MSDEYVIMKPVWRHSRRSLPCQPDHQGHGRSLSLEMKRRMGSKGMRMVSMDQQMEARRRMVSRYLQLHFQTALPVETTSPVGSANTSSTSKPNPLSNPATSTSVATAPQGPKSTPVPTAAPSRFNIFNILSRPAQPKPETPSTRPRLSIATSQISTPPSPPSTSPVLSSSPDSLQTTPSESSNIISAITFESPPSSPNQATIIPSQQAERPILPIKLSSKPLPEIPAKAPQFQSPANNTKISPIRGLRTTRKMSYTGSSQVLAMQAPRPPLTPPMSPTF